MQVKTKIFSKDFLASHEMMILTNLKDGACMDVNFAFLKTLEIDRSDIVGKSALELRFLNPKDREILEQCVKTCTPIKDYEIVVRSNSGAVIVGLLSCFPFRMKNKHYLITAVTDITQQKYQEVKGQKLQEFEKLERSAN